MTGEYWLAKAQESDVSSDPGGLTKGAVYLPRRTSRRRISHALGLSMDSLAVQHYAQYYHPFLEPPNALTRRDDVNKQVLFHTDRGYTRTV